MPVFGPAREAIPGRTRALVEGDTFIVPETGLELAMLDVPGHTAGHIAYVGANEVTRSRSPATRCSRAGCGRLFEGTPAQMVASLAKLAALPADTRVYCGHEYTLANLALRLPSSPAIER